MYCQMNDKKHTKTFISRPFGNSLDLRLVGDLYFFLPTRHESIGKKKKKKKKKKHFSLRGSKKTFSHRF